jgi:hypothetical protein
VLIALSSRFSRRPAVLTERLDALARVDLAPREQAWY